MYGHVYKLTEAVIEALTVLMIEVNLYRVPELIPDLILEQKWRQTSTTSIRTCTHYSAESIARSRWFYFWHTDTLWQYMRTNAQFFDTLDTSHANNTFANKVGSVYTSISAQYPPQETTVTHFHTTLLQLGMVIAGLSQASIQPAMQKDTLPRLP